MEAAKWVEMVRINPGNYADSKKFAIKEYPKTNTRELKRMRIGFPVGETLQGTQRAMRIGTNTGRSATES